MRFVINRILKAARRFRNRHHKAINAVIFVVAFSLAYFHLDHATHVVASDIQVQLASITDGGGYWPLIALLGAAAGIALTAGKEVGHAAKKIYSAAKLAWRFVRRKVWKK